MRVYRSFTVAPMVAVLAAASLGAPPVSAGPHVIPDDCTVLGTDGDDVLYGTADADVICGLGGNDLLRGNGSDGDGPDYLYGGPGRDRTTCGRLFGLPDVSGVCVVDGGPDTDDLQGGPGDDVLSGGDGRDRLRGRDGDDVLRGGDRNDWLFGGDGDDVISGNGGRDQLHGGAGSDTIQGGNGDDLILGESGHDVIIGGPGDDWMEPWEGDDVLDAGPGNDTLWGGPGRDRLDGHGGNDVLHGGDGDDRLVGGAGADVLRGDDGADVLIGGKGRDNRSSSRAQEDRRTKRLVTAWRPWSSRPLAGLQTTHAVDSAPAVAICGNIVMQDPAWCTRSRHDGRVVWVRYRSARRPAQIDSPPTKPVSSVSVR